MRFRLADSGERFEFAPREVILAGFTGRDRARVAAHVEELRREGIVAPAKTPVFYRVEASLLSAASIIEVASARTAGEAEPVLLFREGGWCVTVGSDHTDRDLERTDVHASKAVCPKVVSDEVWRFDDVRDHWDRIGLHSWVGAALVLYQAGMLADLMPVGAIVDAMRAAGVDPNGCVALLGTIPLRAPAFDFLNRFEAELFDPVRKRALRIAYEVRRKDDAKTRA